MLHNMKEKLCHVVADGDVLVLLPRRSVPPRPPPPEPTKVREIESGLAGRGRDTALPPLRIKC